MAALTEHDYMKSTRRYYANCWDSASHRRSGWFCERNYTKQRHISAFLKDEEGPKRRRVDLSLTRTSGEVRDLFISLKGEWIASTRFDSSVHKIVMHPAYQRIIGLGPQAVPLIIHELRRTGPGHWFWALAAITGEDPASGVHSLEEATTLWLDWAADRGISGE